MIEIVSRAVCDVCGYIIEKEPSLGGSMSESVALAIGVAIKDSWTINGNGQLMCYQHCAEEKVDWKENNHETQESGKYKKVSAY